VLYGKYFGIKEKLSLRGLNPSIGLTLEAKLACSISPLYHRCQVAPTCQGVLPPNLLPTHACAVCRRFSRRCRTRTVALVPYSYCRAPSPAHTSSCRIVPSCSQTVLSTALARPLSCRCAAVVPGDEPPNDNPCAALAAGLC
jgi:hypothetical protein